MVAPDCFDVGMVVTEVQVRGEEAPYLIDVEIAFGSYSGEDVEDSFTLTVDSRNFDICAAAIESMSEIVADNP